MQSEPSVPSEDQIQKGNTDDISDGTLTSLVVQSENSKVQSESN